MGEKPTDHPDPHRTECPVCGRTLEAADPGGRIERTLVVTASGALFAVWNRGTIWWIRPGGAECPDHVSFPDVWIRSDRPHPWPCDQGLPISFRLARSGRPRSGQLERPDGRWTTEPVVRTETWDHRDPWPGEPSDLPSSTRGWGEAQG